MKILHFIETLRSGGKERQLVELLKGLSEYSEIKSYVAVMSNNIHYHAICDNIYFLIRNRKHDPKILLDLYSLCKKLKPDIIHVWGSMLSVYALPVAKLLKIKFINGMIRNATNGLGWRNKYWRRGKLTFPFSNVIVSNSYAGIKAYGAPLSKSICIHNGFDLERINLVKEKEFIKKKLCISTTNIVGMVASFTNNKDYETYILAAQNLLKEKEDVAFLAVGDGENLEKCKQLVEEPFREKIRFLGKRTDVESIINIFDVAVLATYTEGISNSIMEYMALAKPVVATSCKGNAEIIINGKTGFLTNLKDPNDMYKKILLLLNNKEFNLKMGKEGRKKIVNEFSLSKMVYKYVNVYKGLLSNK